MLVTKTLLRGWRQELAPGPAVVVWWWGGHPRPHPAAPAAAGQGQRKPLLLPADVQRGARGAQRQPICFGSRFNYAEA